LLNKLEKVLKCSVFAYPLSLEVPKWPIVTLQENMVGAAVELERVHLHRAELLGVEPLLMFLAYFEGGLKGVRCREAFLATF
jgi:hypothetical protein